MLERALSPNAPVALSFSLSLVSVLSISLSLARSLSLWLCVLMINNVWMETCFRLRLWGGHHGDQLIGEFTSPGQGETYVMSPPCPPAECLQRVITHNHFGIALGR